MKNITKGQYLVEARSGKIVPDLESIQVYPHMQEAQGLQDFLGSARNIGQAADQFASTLEAILDGRSFTEIGEEVLLRLVRAISALLQSTLARQLSRTLTHQSSSLLQWPG